MPTTSQLPPTSKSVVLNASGTGTVTIGPTYYGEQWHVTNLVVTVSSATLRPMAKVYLGPAVASNQQDSTFSGDNDSSDTVYDLFASQVLTIVWTGGDVGATATATVAGQKTVG